MKFFAAYLVSLFFFSLTYSSSYEEFTRVDVLFIIGLLTLASTIQACIVFVFKKWKVTQNILLAIFTLANIITLNLILNENIIALSTLLKLGILSVGIFIIYTLMNIIDENSKLGKLGVSAAIIAILFNFGSTLFGNPVPGIFAVKSTGTSAENIKTVKFKQKPNVYIVLFDSFVPKSIMKKHFGVDKAPYHDVLDEHFQKFENFFVERVPSKPSLNRLLALDSKYYAELSKPEGKLQFRLFQGFAPSPLFQIFKHNGYDTKTLYNSRYFGKAQGPYIDEYLVNKDFGACEFIERKYKKFTFFGMCNLKTTLDKSEPVDFLISKMQEGVDNGRPQIIVSYVYSPGHTEKSYDHEDPKKVELYKNQYLENSKVTAESLNKIISFLQEKDPTAMLYLSGDHGPWLSRQVKYEDDPKFFIQDRHAVFGGVFPKGNCAQSFSKPYTDKFVTISQGTHMIIQCLTGGQNAFITQDAYKLPKKTNQGWDRYENYLYE